MRSQKHKHRWGYEMAVTKKTAELIAQARVLRQAGYTWAALGRAMEVNHETVRGWIDPEFAQAKRDRINRNRSPKGKQPFKFVGQG